MRLLLLFLTITSIYGAMIGIDFKGNETFDKCELYSALGIERKWWQKILFQNEKPKVDDKLLPILLEELQAFYKDQGFWNTKIDVKLKDHLAIFYIKENDPIVIRSIQITSDFPIRDLIDLHEHDRFIASKFKTSKEKVAKALLEKGYCSYDFDPKAYIFEKKRSAHLVYRLNKGSICRIGSIKINGLKTIKKETVLSHIYLKPGEAFSLDRVQQSYRKLYSLGYFRFINIDYSKKIKNTIMLNIDLKERQHRNIYKAGLGYDTQNGIHLSFYYKHLNKRQFQPSIDLFYSNIKKEAKFKLFYPSIELFGYYFDTLTTIAYEQNSFDSFSQKGSSLSFKLLKDLYSVQGSLGIKFERLRIYDTDPCIEAKNYTLLYPQLLAVYDKRNSKLFPTNGFYLKDSLDLSVANNRFLKNSFTAGFYFPIKQVTLFAKATLGTITANSLPPNMLFYGGGINSNRAYTFRGITALDSDCLVGGKTLLDTTIEPRFRYNDSLQIALFWDRTYLSRHELKLSNPVDGVGFGVIYDTPIGALRLYLGLDPRTPSQNAINLFLGASF